MSPAAALWRGVLAVSSLLSICVQAEWDNITSPTASLYFSRPDLLVPVLNVSIADYERVEPGYIFMAPYQDAHAGPYIYDKAGVGSLGLPSSTTC